MAKLFLDILNLSITASFLIVAVLAVRFIFRKRAPKWVNCLLWAMVGLRLVLPFTIESPISFSVNREVINTDAIYGEAPADTAPPADTVPPTDDEIVIPPVVDTVPDDNYIQSGIGALDDRINPVIKDTVSSAQPSEENVLQKVIDIASYIWLSGTLLLLAYAVINYLLLKYRVSSAIPCGNTVRKSERVDTPFILGFFRPRIYLPFGLSAETEECVVSHENAHIKRKDHLIKPLGYAILSVYWFNPLVWVAYILLCRDIESACDEKVIKDLSAEARKAYATALLECSVRKNYIAACPLAFGEIGVKNRVKNTINYRKPAFWVIISALLVCVTVSVLFLTSPAGAENDISETVSEDSRQTESSDTSDTDVSNDVSSSDTSEYIGEVSVNDEASAESSDANVSEEISDEVSEEVSADVSDEISEVESIEESTPVEDEVSNNVLAPGNPIQKTHQTPERLGESSEITEYTARQEQSPITPIYIVIKDMDYSFNTDSDNNIIKESGLKVWICTKDCKKVDYVYTNSKGVAAFEAMKGEYTFYFEGNDKYAAKYYHKTVVVGEVYLGRDWSYEYNTGYRRIRYPIYSYVEEKHKDLKIYVTDAETGKPIMNAYVNIQAYDGNYEAYTDANGVATTKSLLASFNGDLLRDISVSADGYRPIDDYINIKKVKNNEVHIQLNKTVYHNVKITCVDAISGAPIKGVVAEPINIDKWDKESRIIISESGEDGVISLVITDYSIFQIGWHAMTLTYTDSDGISVACKYTLNGASGKGKENVEYTLRLEKTDDGYVILGAYD